jgi:hypothetical protein
VTDDDRRGRIARDLATALGADVPGPLLDLWTGRGGVTRGSGVDIATPDDIVELNEANEVARYRPDLLLIGTDGGGRALLVPRGVEDPQVFLIDTGAIGSDDGTVMGTLGDLVDRGFPLPDDEPAGPLSRTVDILLARRPEAGVRAIGEIRRALGVTLPLNTMTGPGVSYPVVLLPGVVLARYHRAVEDLNRRYGCIDVR